MNGGRLSLYQSTRRAVEKSVGITEEYKLFECGGGRSMQGWFVTG